MFAQMKRQCCDNKANMMTSGLYYKHILTLVSDDHKWCLQYKHSLVIRMMPQLWASLTIVILATLGVSFMLLESSIMLLENIYTTGIPHGDCHLRSSYLYSTGQWSPHRKEQTRTKMFAKEERTMLWWLSKKDDQWLYYKNILTIVSDNHKWCPQYKYTLESSEWCHNFEHHLQLSFWRL